MCWWGSGISLSLSNRSARRSTYGVARLSGMWLTRVCRKPRFASVPHDGRNNPCGIVGAALALTITYIYTPLGRISHRLVLADFAHHLLYASPRCMGALMLLAVVFLAVVMLVALGSMFTLQVDMSGVGGAVGSFFTQMQPMMFFIVGALLVVMVGSLLVWIIKEAT